MEEEANNLKYTIIYLTEERVYGELLSYGTYTSMVRYRFEGIEYEGIIFNDEFEIIEEIVIPEIEEN